MQQLTEQEIKMAMPILNIAVNAMKKDGVTYEMAMAMTAEQQIELVRVYVSVAFKKIEQMQTMYMTNPEFKQTMIDLIYCQLTQKGA